MTRLRRPLLAAALAACALVACVPLVGCSSIARLFSDVSFRVPEVMPTDFFFGLQVREAMRPEIDYLVKVNRSGKVGYDTTVRAPRRASFSGEVELTEDEVRSIYAAVVDSDFASYDDRYVASGGATLDRAHGKRAFYVLADGLEKRIDVEFVSVPGLDQLQKRVMAVLPPKILDAQMGPDIDRTSPDQFIGDTATNIFHLPGCPQVEKIPPGRRQAFRTQYEAYDFNFHPCEECRPEKTQ